MCHHAPIPRAVALNAAKSTRSEASGGVLLTRTARDFHWVTGKPRGPRSRVRSHGFRPIRRGKFSESRLTDPSVREAVGRSRSSRGAELMIKTLNRCSAVNL